MLLDLTQMSLIADLLQNPFSNHWLLDSQSIRSTRTLDYRYCTPRQHASIQIFFSNIIQRVGKRLSLRHIPLATANIFFKRFYLKSALCETDPFLVVSACVYVAAKVEETPVHIKSVVSESRHCYNGKSYWRRATGGHRLPERSEELYLLRERIEHSFLRGARINLRTE
jgi:cyclin-C